MKTIVVPIEGDVRVEDVSKIDLDYLSGVVGGYIEAVTLRGVKVTMYINEEGKLDGLDVNRRATQLAWAGGGIDYSDFIVGNVVLVGAPDTLGNDTGLTEWQVERFSKAFE